MRYTGFFLYKQLILIFYYYYYIIVDKQLIFLLLMLSDKLRIDSANHEKGKNERRQEWE
jgi:hypothetical protein